MKFTFSPESRVLDGYTIKRAIYRGGFGEVYYALSDAGREVALKLLQNNADIELRGVQQCLNLSHPNLVTIFDVREDADGDHWILMEYVSGETLDAAIRRHPGGMPMEEVRRWLKGIAAGVGHLHSRGLVHRDLKPANIFSGEGAIKVGDVGLSKFITHSRRSAQTQSVGTVYYMAPEVANGRYGKEVDIYALGVMLYEMLTGTLPFDGESTAEILMKHLTAAPDLSLLPPRVRPVMGRALEKSPERRYASAEAFEQAFHAAVVGKSEPLEITEEHFLGSEPEAVMDAQSSLVQDVPVSPPTSPLPGPSGSLSETVVKTAEQRAAVGFNSAEELEVPTVSSINLPSLRAWWCIGLGGISASVIVGLLDLLVNGQVSEFGVQGLPVFLFVGYVANVIRQAKFGPWPFEQGQVDFERRSIFFPTGWWIALMLATGVISSKLLADGSVFDSAGSRFHTNHDLGFTYWAWGMLAGYLLTVIVRQQLGTKSVEVSGHGAKSSTPDSEFLLDLAPSRTSGNAAVEATYRRLDGQPWRLKARWAEWLQSAALAPFAVAIFTSAVVAVGPSFFLNGASGTFDYNIVAYFGLASLLTVWGTMLVAKLTERERAVSTSKWWFAGTGAVIGLAVGGLHQALMVNSAFSLDGTAHSAIFEHIGELSLFERGVGPTLAGFVVFFAGLLAFRAWPRQMDRDRKARFRIGALLMTVLTAWLWGSVFIFPRVWAMLLAAVVSASVQVLSVWSAERSARRHGRSA